MTKSDVKSLVVKVVLVKSITLDHYEDTAGNTITQIDEGQSFYGVGYYTQNSTVIANATVWLYQTDSAGTPVSPYVRQSGTTDSAGKYSIGPFVAPDVTADTTVYFVAYDDAQKPT